MGGAGYRANSVSGAAGSRGERLSAVKQGLRMIPMPVFGRLRYVVGRSRFGTRVTWPASRAAHSARVFFHRPPSRGSS